MGHVRALLFDFGGTLDVPGGHWLDRFLAQYRAAGLAISRPELDHAFVHATRVAYQSGEALRGAGLEQLLYFLVGEQLTFLAANGPDAVRRALVNDRRDRILDSIADAFVAETLRGLAHSREVLTALARRYWLGVVSNFYGNLDRILTETGLAPLFGATADSVRVGFFKPDRRIFEAALSALGARPQEAAMIGDSLDKDCQPARALGLRTVWLRGSDAPAASRSSLADYTIGSLDELKDLRW